MSQKSSKNPLPLTMPSSTKTVVGLPQDDAPPSARPQKTLLGSGPEHEAVQAFLSAEGTAELVSRGAAHIAAPMAGSSSLAPTLVGMPSEPPPPVVASAPRSSRPSLAAPLSQPLGYAAPYSARASQPSLADLPHQRPVLAAVGVALAVATWALMVLYLFAV